MASPLKKVAVLGTGSIGMRHLNTLRQVRNIEPVAISKRDSNFSKLQGVFHCIIASDTACHVEDTLRTFQYGCHNVLIEKPLAPCVKETLPLLIQTGKAGQRIFVGCVLRFSESLNQFRSLLEKIGLVYSVHISCQSYLPNWRPERDYRQSYSAREKEGGVLLDLIHEIDYAGWIFGWPETLQARLRNLKILDIQAEETAELWWETEGGVSVSIALDYLTRPSRRKMTAYGKEGTLEWDGISGIVILDLANKKRQIFKSHQTRDEMYLHQLKAFLNTESTSLLATAIEGIKALSVCDAARLASQNRREEPVRYPV